MNKLSIKILILLILLRITEPICLSQTNSTRSEGGNGVSVSLPELSGNFGVGRVMQHLIDGDRADPFATEAEQRQGSKRELIVWLYYPAAPVKTRGETVLPLPQWAGRHQQELVRRLGARAAEALITLKSWAQTDAAIAARPRRFPVLIFAPGMSWLPNDYSAIIEDLTSRGYLIAAIAPPRISSIVIFPDGRAVTAGKFSDSIYDTLADDIRFVRRQLEKIDGDRSSRFFGRLDLTRVGAFGHSVGGAAAVSAGTDDQSIRAVANLDGDYGGSALLGKARQPILYITSEPFYLGGVPIEQWDRDGSELRRARVWESVRAGSTAPTRVRIRGMYHSNFQDAALLPSGSVPDKLSKTRFGPIDGERGLRLSTELVARFFDLHLRSRPISGFLALQSQYPEIRIGK